MLMLNASSGIRPHTCTLPAAYLILSAVLLQVNEDSVATGSSTQN